MMLMEQNTQTSHASRARPWRRWLRYSLRSLFVLVTLTSVMLGVWVNRAERQRRAVAAIRAAGGTVRYDYEQAGAQAAGPVDGQLPGPDWLCRLLSVDYFAD